MNETNNKNHEKHENAFDKAKNGEVTLEAVKNNAEIREYIRASNHNLSVMGYTEHGLRHVARVSTAAANILKELGYDNRTAELAAIAGWCHDIGNAVNRTNHGITGATMVYTILTALKMKAEEISAVIGAIGNHEEEVGTPINDLCAALIIADKSDSHRSRVSFKNAETADIHERVNLAIKKNYLTVDREKRRIRLVLIMNSDSSPMEYLEIYLSRITLCEKAAKFLNCHFELMINGTIINKRQRLIKAPPFDKTERPVTEI